MGPAINCSAVLLRTYFVHLHKIPKFPRINNNRSCINNFVSSIFDQSIVVIEYYAPIHSMEYHKKKRRDFLMSNIVYL